MTTSCFIKTVLVFLLMCLMLGNVAWASDDKKSAEQVFKKETKHAPSQQSKVISPPKGFGVKAVIVQKKNNDVIIDMRNKEDGKKDIKK